MKIFNKIILLLLIFLNFFYCSQKKLSKKLPNIFKDKPYKKNNKKKKKQLKKQKEQFEKINNIICDDTLDLDVNISDENLNPIIFFTSEDSSNEFQDHKGNQKNNYNLTNIINLGESNSYSSNDCISNEFQDHKGNQKNLFKINNENNKFKINNPINLKFSNFTLVNFEIFKNDFIEKINNIFLKNDFEKNYDNYVESKKKLLNLNDLKPGNFFYENLKAELNNANESENFEFLNKKFINFLNNFIIECSLFKEQYTFNKENISIEKKQEIIIFLKKKLKDIYDFKVNENNLNFFKHNFNNFFNKFKDIIKLNDIPLK